MVGVPSGLPIRFKANCCIVDICITTTLKELEQVCILAEFLANRTCFDAELIGIPGQLISARWYGACGLRFACQGSNCENMGPRTPARL